MNSPCEALRSRLLDQTQAAEAGRDPHLAACPACREAALGIAIVHAAAEAWRDEAPPVGLRARVLARTTQRSPRARGPALVLWMGSGAAAAALLLAVLLRGQPDPLPLKPPAPEPSTPTPAVAEIPKPAGTEEVRKPTAVAEAPKPQAGPGVRNPVEPAASELPKKVPERHETAPELAETPKPQAGPGPAPTPESPAPETPREEDPVEAITPEAPLAAWTPQGVPVSFALSDLGGIQAGPSVLGPPPSPADLSGNVVLVVYWGADCGASRAALPALGAFEKRLREKPFRALGIESQKGNPDDVRRLCKEAGVEFPVVSGGQILAAPVKGLPYAAVFDPAGQHLFSGKLAEAEGAVEKALATSPKLYLGATRFERLKTLAAQVEHKTRLGAAAATLRRKADAAGADAAEARALLAAMTAYATRQTAVAQALRDTDPDENLARLKELAADFQGDALGKEAAASAEKTAADPGFQKLRKGLKDLAVQEKALDDLPCCKTCQRKGLRHAQLSCLKCLQMNETELTRIRKALEKLAQEHAGGPVAERALTLAVSLDVASVPK